MRLSSTISTISVAVGCGVGYLLLKHELFTSKLEKSRISKNRGFGFMLKKMV